MSKGCLDYVVSLKEEGHIYTVNGVTKASVSSVLKAGGLMDWTKNIHPYFAEKGSMVHLACHLLDTTGLDMDTVDDRIKGYVTAYKLFKESTGVQVILSEVAMYDKQLDCCGTLDKLYRWNDQEILVDIKSNSIPPTAEVQISAYEKMLTSFFGRKADSSRILVLKESGNFVVSPVLNTRNGMKVFKAANEIAKWKGLK